MLNIDLLAGISRMKVEHARLERSSTP